MTMVRVKGMAFPGANTFVSGGVGLGAVSTIDATGEKLCWWGPVRWFDGSSSKQLRKFHFYPATVVSAGGSGLTMSIQDISTTGNPPQPDGTQDQTCNFNINTITTSTWFVSPALGSDRTVNHGDLIAVVLEFDGGGRLGSDSLSINHGTINTGGLNPPGSWGGDIFFNGASWGGGVSSITMCQLEFSDGTFGQLGTSLPITNYSSTNFNTGSAADEFALRFQVPFDCVADGCWAVFNQQAAGRNVSVNLYRDTTLLTSIMIDAELTTLTNVRYDISFPAEVALTRGNTYYLAVQGLSASNVSVAQFTMASTAYLAAMEGGPEFYQATRKGGAWTTDQNTVPNFGIRISQVDDGSGVVTGVFRLEGIASARY